MLCCPRGFRQLCIRKSPAQFCFNTLGTTLHRSKPYAIISERLQATMHKKTILCKIVLILLGQHCPAENPMQYCHRGSRQLCIRKTPVQCYLNTLGTTLRRSKPYTMLCERLQATLHKKTLCNFALILLGQHCTSKNPMQCCLRGPRQH